MRMGSRAGNGQWDGMWLGLWSRSRSTGHSRALGPGGTRRRRCRSRPGPIVWTRRRRDGRHRRRDGRHRRSPAAPVDGPSPRPWPWRPGWRCWPPPFSAPRVSGNSTGNGIRNGSRHREQHGAPAPTPLLSPPAFLPESAPVWTRKGRFSPFPTFGIPPFRRDPGSWGEPPPPPSPSSPRSPGSAFPIPRGSVPPPPPGIPKVSPGERGIR